MPPVVAIVGYSNSGKTRVASSLIRSFSGQGYRVAAVKHCPHGHDIERGGSDTDRLSKAGAVAVTASSPGKLTRVERVNGDSRLESIVSALDNGIDIVVAEGFKTSGIPKVLVLDSSPSPTGVKNIVAIVSDAPGPWKLPTYSFNALDMLADQLRKLFLEAAPPLVLVSLQVNGSHVPLKAYPSRVLAGMVAGFVSSLNGVPAELRDVQITVQTPLSHHSSRHDVQTPKGYDRLSSDMPEPG